jgi:two-component system chemotaxis sensor kinase CheA
MRPKDRYRYFRVEARELLDGLSRGVLELERSPGDRALVARLLRLAHTLKGAARVVQQQTIGDLAHAAEDALEPHREEGSPPVSAEHVDALLRVLDETAAAVAALGPAPAPAPAPAPGPEAPPPAAEPAAAPDRPPDHPFDSVRVDVRELDGLLASVLEAGVQVTTLRRQLGGLDHVEEVARALSDQLSVRRGGDGGAAALPRARALVEELRRSLGEARRALGGHADQAESEIVEVRNSADRLRLLPARAVFGALERGARDAARALERTVRFETAGGDVRVDAAVLSAIRDALLHAVRNAVAHGLEAPAERARLGKAAAGTIRVEVERRGRRVVFSCKDDGAGIDAGRVRAEAVRKGLVAPQEAPALDGEALAALLLRGGLSTSSTVNAVSGRGVGLDVVRDTAARLDAQVALRSEPGRGATVEIAVPVSVAALTALHVDVGGATAALPLDAVRRTAFVAPERVVRMADGAGLEHEGTVIPFVPLARVLGRPVAATRRFWSTVVVQAGPRLVALGADRLVGTSDVVVRPLPAFVDADPAVAGAALDAEGNPRLVLDPAGLLAAVAGAAQVPDDAARGRRAPILVVDDSLTTRMLEQSILESAGYEVELAVSAEEALDKARARRFGVFIVDVEMPGMDGFEFVRVTRADPRTAAPAILVTSRGAPEDRQRGLDAGASAYVVKGEFDQGRLLAKIEELLG